MFKYMPRNKENQKIYLIKWKKENPDKVKEYNKIWYENNGGRESVLKRLLKNKDKINEKRRKYVKKRLKENPKLRIDASMRSMIWFAIKEKKAKLSWENWVGYNLKNLTEHLEKKFNEDMNWENYGSYWHIDHIKPKSWFKFKTPKDKEFKKCWALENLQPLERVKNYTKSNRFIG